MILFNASWGMPQPRMVVLQMISLLFFLLLNETFYTLEVWCKFRQFFRIMRLSGWKRVGWRTWLYYLTMLLFVFCYLIKRVVPQWNDFCRNVFLTQMQDVFSTYLFESCKYANYGKVLLSVWLLVSYVIFRPKAKSKSNVFGAKTLYFV